MFLTKRVVITRAAVICAILTVGLHFTSFGQAKNDSLKLRYPIQDRRGDNLSSPNNSPYYLRPRNYQDSVVYDAISRRYIVYEKIGNKYYKVPTEYTFDEYWAMRNRQAEQEYFRKRASITSMLNRPKLKPKLSLTDGMFNRLFGSGKIEIAPQGNVDITAGYMGQRIDNPTLPERARRTGGLDFNMNAQVAVNANIGDKLKFPINYNTIANMDMENQLKLDYKGKDDEILKRFEAGNVAFPSRSTLIPGAQQLFGLKTQLQFGKLYITTVLANQKSQRQSVALQGGAAAQFFEVRADEYEENRHFLLGQYFRDNYNTVMKNLPAVTSPVQILKLEVWVTNRVGNTTDTRDVVGLMDLGERNPYRPYTILNNAPVPSNNTNDLYTRVISQPEARNPAMVFNNLSNLGLSPVQDFEKTFARKLDSTQYTWNSRAGNLSLNQQLMPDEVLAVAYQYTYNGKIYQVGEFAQDVPPDTAIATQKVLFLKLLKATSQRTALPIWHLMMKNVYSIGWGQLQANDFKLDVLFEEPGLGSKRYVPFGNKNQGSPIISLINLDRLNSQLDPQPDGVFDYVEGYTVVSNQSRIIFPVLEPFGRDLAKQIYSTVPGTAKDTLFYALYDSIKAVAQQYPALNRFMLKGMAKTSGSSEINIGYNIPPGSVTVSAGGRILQPGADYDINYDLGTIKITNMAILNSGYPVQVNFENNAQFGMQQRSYMGLRLDYLLKNTPKEQIAIGGTAVRLSERPFFTKVNLNEDPIRNAMFGLDVNYRRETPRLTKWLDKLPFYKANGASNVNVYAEAAMLKPGHAPQIGRGKNGVIYIDDFEGSNSGIDLRFPAIAWTLASTPFGARDDNGNLRFPEAGLNNNIDYGKNRAKIAWYQIEQALQQYKGENNPLGNKPDFLSDPRTRIVYQKEIFPQRSVGFGESQLLTFDMAYFPTERGPYNFDALGINSNGRLQNPAKRWGGLMRNIDQTDFETGNIEYIEFWMQDPFILPSLANSSGGKLYFNLGNISEDVLKDGRRYFENGMPTPGSPTPTDNTAWGRVPRNPIQITNAFSNVAGDRLFQDIGFDGLSDTAEANRYTAYLNQLATTLGVGSPAYQKAFMDPSSDNFKNYRDGSFTDNDDIIQRYKNFNGPEGNSPVNTGSQFLAASTLYPDAEDLNRDNTLNETEEYFQYKVDLKPSTNPTMSIGQNFIVDKKPVQVKLVNGQTRTETWYQFRIPIGAFNAKVGNIPDFKSIRFIRMYMTDFTDSVVVRFGDLQLTRNMWRKFRNKIDTSGISSPQTFTQLNVGAVNIEENDQRKPLPYRTPREIERAQTQSNNGVTLLMNEQAMSLKFCDLAYGDAKGVFQTFGNKDLRQFKSMKMYVHTEDATKTGNELRNKDLTAILRIGSDFINNYYEIRLPLKITDWRAGTTMNVNTDQYNDSLWANQFDVDLLALTQLKQERDISSSPFGTIYRKRMPDGQTYGVMGAPNLAEVRGILIAVENTELEQACAEVWVNELRLQSINEKGGYAGLARVDVQLSDLGTLSLSGNFHTAGFGTLEQRVNERSRDNFYQFDISTNLQLGKLLPKKAGVEIPVFASYSQSVSTPEYDPFDKDVRLKDKLSSAPSSKKDSIRSKAIDYRSTKTLSFTNVRKVRTNTTKRPKIYDISNFDLSYSYFSTNSHTPLIEYNDVTRHRGMVGYTFVTQPKFISPFKALLKKNNNKWLTWLKDFNINYVPSNIAIKADLSRQFGVIRPRSIGTDKYVIPETYDKYFTFQRDYVLDWDFTKSLKLRYTATNNSRIDEPEGRIDTRQKRDSIWKNLFRGGRNTIFNQAATIQYTLPTAKIPLLDWTTVNLQYQTNYRWIGASRLAVDLGNILENGNQAEARAQLDFSRLYQKSKWLRQLDNPANPEDKERWKNRYQKVKDTIITKTGQKIIRTKRKLVDKGAMPYVSGIPKVFGKLLTSIKQANVTFSENANTRLPGYADSTQFIGQNFRSMAPGFDFIFGRQPDSNWLNKKAAKGLITKNDNFNEIFQQNFEQRLTGELQLQPFRDLNIGVNFKRSFSKNYSETFKFVDTSGGTNKKFQHLTPYAGGGFDVSWIAINTLFKKFDPNTVSETFRTFEANRQILSRRMGETNPYSISGGGQGADGYYYGYGKYAVDVLIPSFIAAYTGKSPESVGLIKQGNSNIKANPFRAIIPKPNWRLDYNGLSRLKGLEKIFTNVSISHAYNGSLSMNGFTSALLYQDISRFGYPSFYDTISKNFIPYFLVPNITITDQFGPVAGIDLMFTNQLHTKFEYNRTRTLSMSLYDFQLSETHSKEMVFDLGYRKRGLKLFAGLKLPKFLTPSTPGGSNKLENDINFTARVSIRDNVTANTKLDGNITQPTNGSKDITITPSIDYYLSNRVNIRFYYERRSVKPYLGTIGETVNTKAGVQIRISLAQ